MNAETATATEFTAGTKVRVVASPNPKVLPNGTTGTVHINLGPDSGDPDFGGTGDRLFLNLDNGARPALYSSEVEVVD